MFQSFSINRDESRGTPQVVHGRTEQRMTPSILDSNSETKGLGVSFRKNVPGPEHELLDWFLEQQPIRAPRGCRATFFREPRLESGFPDLVAVIWHVNTG